MSKPIIYIDGQAGTTGLQIASRLKERDDLELIFLEDEKRHDNDARKAMMEKADLVFLCLPDAAAIEAAAMCPEDTLLIDASTAHRTDPSWTYGFPELNAQAKEAVKKSRRTANPGCHATGAIALLSPLVQSGLLDPEAFVSIYSLTGYTGGGKKMIAEYENNPSDPLQAPGTYARGLHHKHLPEIEKFTGLKTTPAFLPVVADYPRGMLVSIAIDSRTLREKKSLEELRALYADWYKESPVISVSETEGTLYAGTLAGSDSLRIEVSGNEQQILLQALFDNLGKGASGAAIQNMNLMLNLDECAGLHLECKQN